MPSQYGPVAVNHVTGALEYSASVGSGQITDDSVTSADIAAGTIVNSDVNASAAIAESKLALTYATHAPIYSDVKRRSSGDITVNSVTWINLDNNLDIVLTAVSGDKVEVAVNGLWSNEATNGYLDVATIVSAAPVTYVSSATGTPSTNGVTGWVGFGGTFDRSIGSTILALASGDVSGGQVRLRLRTRTEGATNKVLFATTTWPLAFTAKNLGPS